MELDLLEIITGLLVKAYNMTDGEVSELLNSENATVESVQTALLNRDKARIAALKQSDTGKFQEGYKKAKSEVLTENEKSLREKYGITDETLQGTDLVDAIIALKNPEAGKGKKELTDDDVKKHPVYQQLEAASKKAVRDKETEWTNKWNEREAEIEENNNFSSASGDILTHLEKLNPVLPKNAEAAANLKKIFVEDFKKEYKFQKQGNKILVLDKDGKTLDDGHGHTLQLEDLVKSRAGNYFDLSAQNGGANGGNGKDQNKPDEQSGRKQYPAGITRPKNREELDAILNNASIPHKDRTAALEAYKSENPDSKE